ncbi:hypothetical protein K8T06_03085, partial [bacterium]|nr:hypothetical protein [bacterium]
MWPPDISNSRNSDAWNSMWFLAMWWVCTQKTGGSAKDLQKFLGLGSYQTAWSWLHKLRRAMIN